MGRGKKVACWTLVVACVTLQFVFPIRYGGIEDVDCAWQGVLHSDWLKGTSFADVLFPYGPAGFLLAPSTFGQDQLLLRQLLANAIAIAIAIALVAFVRHLPQRTWRWTWLGALVVLLPHVASSSHFLAVAVLGLGMLLDLTAPRPATAGRRYDARIWAQTIATMLLFAVEGYGKISYLVFSVACVGTTAAVLLTQRRPQAAIGLGGAMAATLLTVWVALGQPLADLPVWLRGEMEICDGYNDSMGHVGDAALVALAALTMALCLALAVWLLTPIAYRAADAGDARRLDMRAVGAAATLLLGLGLTWKAAFVRQDRGHTEIFFGFAALAPVLLTAAGLRKPLTQLSSIAVAGAAVLPLVTLALASPQWTFGLHSTRCMSMLAPTAHAAPIELRAEALRREPPLPRIRERVGTTPIDLVGNVQGLMIASGMNVHHRPVFQTYSCYTPYLLKRNGDFFRGDAAPPMVLARVQATDGMWPLLQDGDAWRTLLLDYHPTMVEKNVLLLERNQPVSPPAPRRSVLDLRVKWNEWIDVPPTDDWQLAWFEIRPTVLGRLASAAFRPGPQNFEVRLDNGEQRTHRIGRRLTEAPFLLDPVIRDNRDFVRSYFGTNNRVRAFRLQVEPGREPEYSDDVRVHVDAFTPGQRMPEAARDAVEAVRAAIEFPGFDVLPFQTTADVAVRPLEDQAGVMAHAPAILSLRWPGGRRHLGATFCLLPPSYQKAKGTDGVAFRVEADVAPEPRHILYERLLCPVEAAADRGDQTFDLEVDLPAGTTIRLITDPGPKNNNTFDWAAWRRVTVTPH